MSLDNDNRPIIIKKVKKGGHGHHGGAWKVAYADFVTAMMALFIVLWILGQSEEVKQAVSSYFNDPIGFSENNKGKGIVPVQGNAIIDLDMKAQMERKLQEKKELAEMGEKIVDELQSIPEFEGLADQITIEMVDEGLRIEILDSFDEVFFEIGKSDLKSQAYEIIKKMGTNIAKLNHKIAIEGHTDSRKYSNGAMGYTNFELSAERANSARRALVSGGLKEEQIMEVRGYADKKLKNIKNPFDVSNRRISIIVKYSG